MHLKMYLNFDDTSAKGSVFAWSVCEPQLRLQTTKPGCSPAASGVVKDQVGDLGSSQPEVSQEGCNPNLKENKVFEFFNLRHVQSFCGESASIYHFLSVFQFIYFFEV